jgi:hypothetical protein
VALAADHNNLTPNNLNRNVPHAIALVMTYGYGR